MEIKKSEMRVRGDRGEDAVAARLVERGYRILCRNYKARHGEIDIIAEDDTYILFIEVKSRRLAQAKTRFGQPATAVTYDKRRHIIWSAEEYLRKHPTNKVPRLDVAEVYFGSGMSAAPVHINYMPAAFTKK